MTFGQAFGAACVSLCADNYYILTYSPPEFYKQDLKSITFWFKGLGHFRCNLTYYEGENFSDSSLHHI